MVYIEIPNIEDLSIWVRSLQGLMAGSQVVEKRKMIEIGIRTVAETDNQSLSRKTDL